MRTCFIAAILNAALLINVTADAQVLTPTRKSIPAQGRESQPLAAPQGTSPIDQDEAGAEFLTQAALNGGSITPEVALQAMDLFFSRNYRFYLRTTLPVTRSDSSGEEGSEETRETQIADALKSALIDDYGGLLYTTVGTYRKVFKGWKPYAADADHGLFLDARGGAKFVDISDNAPDTSQHSFTSKVAPFYTGMVGLRIVVPLYKDPALTAEHLAGGFVLGISATGNIAADPDASPLFSDETEAASRLPKRIGALNVSMAISLPGIAYVSLTATPWTSAGNFGKRFVLSFNLVRPKSEGQ